LFQDANIRNNIYIQMQNSLNYSIPKFEALNILKYKFTNNNRFNDKEINDNINSINITINQKYFEKKYHKIINSHNK